MSRPVRLDDIPHHPLEKGFHTPVDNPHLFIDTCSQIWPDAGFDRLHTYGCAAYCVTAFKPHDEIAGAVDAVADWWRIANTYEHLRIALTAADIEAAKGEGGTALVITSQGGDFLGQNLYRLEMMHRLGLRIMIPIYNVRGPLGDGCWEPNDPGLSRLGKAWVDECNRLGLLIDLTHVGERTSFDILDRTQVPVAFTHSNPKALVDSPRCITDEQIKRCADGGGVIGITNWGPLNFRDGATGRPTLEHFLEAIDHVVDLVGIDHVGIGTDMSHGTYPDGDLQRRTTRSFGAGYSDVVESSPRSRLRYVEGFDDYGQIVDVAEKLAARGHGEAGAAKILGGNWLRLFRAVWGA